MTDRQQGLVPFAIESCGLCRPKIHRVAGRLCCIVRKGVKVDASRDIHTKLFPAKGRSGMPISETIDCHPQVVREVLSTSRYPSSLTGTWIVRC